MDGTSQIPEMSGERGVSPVLSWFVEHWLRALGNLSIPKRRYMESPWLSLRHQTFDSPLISSEVGGELVFVLEEHFAGDSTCMPRASYIMTVFAGHYNTCDLSGSFLHKSERQTFCGIWGEFGQGSDSRGI